MRWDHSILVVTGAGATPDPVVAPATVPAANCFRLPTRDPESAEFNDRVIFGLEAVPAEDVDLELWVLDDADDPGGNQPPAAGRWSRFCEVLRLDGSHDRSVPGFAGGGSAVVPGRGGLCYLRVTRETTANNRIVSVTARPGYDGTMDLAMVAGVDVVSSAAGVQAVGGPAAAGADPVGGPVLVGGPATAAPVAVAEGKLARLSFTLTQWLRSLVDLAYIGGTAILHGGVSGSQGVGGLAAQDAALAGNPVPVAGQYRTTELALTALDVAAPGLNAQGYLAAEADWSAAIIDGGGQRVNIGTAAYSAALTAKAKYILIAKADCWIKFGVNNTDPAVAGADFFLPSYTPVQFTILTGSEYCAVITDSATVANGLSICRVK